MKKEIKCPICHGPMKYEYYTECYGIVESYESCNRCGYLYEFAYGNHIECVKGKEFIWSYRTRQDDPIFRRMRKAEHQARSNWKKYKKKYIVGGNNETSI